MNNTTWFVESYPVKMRANRVLSQNIVDVIRQRGLRAEDAAAALNMSLGKFERYCHGQWQWIASDVALFAETFGVPVSDLFRDRDKESQSNESEVNVW